MFYLKWVLLTTACYIILILWRTSRICHQFQKASHDLQVTDVYLKRGNIRQAESSSRDCLEHLGSPLPSGHAARFVMTAWEMVRHVLHIVFIGRFIETVMMYARNDVAMASMQARALSVFLKYVVAPPTMLSTHNSSLAQPTLITTHAGLTKSWTPSGSTLR